MESRGRAGTWMLAGLVAGPLLLLVGMNAADTLLDLSDPCTEWGLTNESSLAPGDACPVRQGHSATRVEYVAARVAIDGLLAYGAVAGLAGVWRRRPALAALGAAALLFVAVPLFVGAFGIVAALFAAVLMIVTRRLAPGTDDAGERAVAAAFAAVLLGLGVLTLAVVVGGPADRVLLPMFAVAGLLGLLFVRAHWPRHAGVEDETEDPRPPSL